jgi:hypothetical protein
MAHFYIGQFLSECTTNGILSFMYIGTYMHACSCFLEMSRWKDVGLKLATSTEDD